jgi:hypothetical protein
MIGCALLTAAGVFVAARLIHGRRHGWGCGGGWHHGHRWRHGGGCHHDDGDFGPGPGGWGSEHGGWGRGDYGGGGHVFMLRGLLSRLETTPAQEQVIRQAVGELRDAGAKLRGEGRRTRADVASAFRKPHFDEVLFGELYARHDREIEDLRKAVVGAGARIHDTLDERQRARLADLIEAGPGWWRRAWRG